MTPPKKRTSKTETADALRKMDSRTVIEWIDREEGYKPTPTKQLTLSGDPASQKQIKAHQVALEQKRLKDYSKSLAIAGVFAAAVSLVGLAITGTDRTAYPMSGMEQANPKDRLPYNLNIKGAEQIRIADTNSMEPVFDAGHVALGIPVPNPEELQVGDIITFYDFENDLVIHRIIEIGEDNGWYAITKGDNNDYVDKPIRFEQVDKVIVGLLY